MTVFTTHPTHPPTPSSLPGRPRGLPHGTRHSRAAQITARGEGGVAGRDAVLPVGALLVAVVPCLIDPQTSITRHIIILCAIKMGKNTAI